MTSPVVRKWIMTWVVLVTCIYSSGCNKLNDKPAGEYLDLALSGMAGSDGVTFEGATALLRGSAGTPYASVYYGGNVKDHNKVTLYTILPDQRSTESESTNHVKEASSATDKPSYYSKLEKKEGAWKVLSESSSQEDNPLPRLNPLHQLEELEGLDKTVTEEAGAGAGRGVRVLRIELSPAEARKQLTNQLEQEMSALRTLGQTQEKQLTANQPQLKKALDTFWQKKNAELKNKLERAQVKTIYHLNVDSRRNLPKRLAWTRTISYPEDAQNALSETYVAQVNFYGYR
ncbi:hypothetical protein [Paenibacillus wynnii]|uniref:Lipoprotein n=1 Tax=Paenibacillus wynnii TaxID=268407 RepID=A0A098M3T1_9BACL|nr:hypothetical protein [Paenibacillus wynnii]KGE16686.1 hypothetical protein PWYN_18475 [Paenibacillus wynnii]